MSPVKSRYPRTLDVAGTEVILDLLTPADEAGLAEFVEGLTTHDMLFMRRNIKVPKVREAWIRRVAEGEITSVAARIDGRIVGTTAIVVDKLSFSAHVGELRVLLGPDVRNMGLGRLLIREAFLVGGEQGLTKLTSQMTLDQDAAITIFEELGFRREAMFQDHVKDDEGNLHDILVMAQEVDRFLAKLEVYGLTSIEAAD